MKTSKATVQTSAQEECGVWLDTVQLKGKAKQKRLARPISKLLNPFAQGGGYSLAVALSFTQTKMEMPKTKQSSISTFFTPHQRNLNKMSTSAPPNMDPSTSTTPTVVTSGRKRGRDTYHEESDLCKSDVDHEWDRENVSEADATLWPRQITSVSPSQNIHCEFEEENFEDFKPPKSKRRLTDTSHLLPGDSQPLPQAWSQDPLLTYSQYAESEFYQASQKNATQKNLSDSEPSFLNSLQSEEGFGNLMDVNGRTSTQKSLKHPHSSQFDDEKENSKSLSFNSPSKRSSFSHGGHLSNHKWAEPKTVLPRKHKRELWKKAEEQEILDSEIKWTKPICSPLKKRAPQQRNRGVDEDSLAMLFTQDSEGFRVIAHRGLQTRSPLKDQSNVSNGMLRTSAFKSLVEEEAEDDMLFTQDSQGNVVIKH
ncbi:aurora kinase A and ninein-interacting protein isoform X3 [Mugil cephalus]|uniref:aurora kinase A and ninein-interacting protein isoform X2 n=1 Tax=Mugil cephalus TaxID=48193 RepID=UPI001FB77E26|nr:aurora kinase A and ninein-interacting protein isoform X2 [Mugil cephalus]XP_047460518.1 aurora kinase A and ninein-interacting protein isoform X3 [Mugil cephalus]